RSRSYSRSVEIGGRFCTTTRRRIPSDASRIPHHASRPPAPHLHARRLRRFQRRRDRPRGCDPDRRIGGGAVQGRAGPRPAWAHPSGGPRERNPAAEVRRAVDLRAVASTDHVKIYTKFTADLLRPLLDEAATLRLPVAAHLGKIDALTAARAGVASLEHMAGVVAAASRDPTPYF